MSLRDPTTNTTPAMIHNSKPASTAVAIARANPNTVMEFGVTPPRTRARTRGSAKDLAASENFLRASGVPSPGASSVRVGIGSLPRRWAP